ncbi:MAG: hypothetical protein QOD84_2628, partial [Acidobacteriaceae bacterium]
ARRITTEGMINDAPSTANKLGIPEARCA